MSTKIKTILLNNSEWLRGRTDSMLLTTDDQLCCLGLACRAFGVADEEMMGVPGLDNLGDILPEGLRVFVSTYLDNTTPIDLEFTSELYTINDDTMEDYADKTRVEDLNHVLKDSDIPIRFKFVANA